MEPGRLQLKQLAFLGPSKEPAYVDFVSGLNVICGASDTGKSFLVEALDFMLGGRPPLRDMPERIGYDEASLSIKNTPGDSYTLARSVSGGSFRCFDGVDSFERGDIKGKILGDRHSANRDDTLSSKLLTTIGLNGYRIIINREGRSRSLSFRNIANLIIVQETEIIKTSSPFLMPTIMNKTADMSVLKTLLSGVDDRAIVSERNTTKAKDSFLDKIELVEKFIQEYQLEIEKPEISSEELQDKHEKLNIRISQQSEKLEVLQTKSIKLYNEREGVREEKGKVINRIKEIGELLLRFDLLDEQYKTDIERLEAIIESGAIFYHLEEFQCPLCGAEPKDQTHDSDCDGNVESIIKAAQAESNKINNLSDGLSKTIVDLIKEKDKLSQSLSGLEDNFNELTRAIDQDISASLNSLKVDFSGLVQIRSDVLKQLDIYDRIDRLEKEKKELEEKNEESLSPPVVKTDLSKTHLGDLSDTIKNILTAWHYPETKEVYFDVGTSDFVINGKPRGSRGKGLRAITHAAVSIGLLEYCRARSLPHPGFLVLDSPLLAYYKPEGEDDSLAGTDLDECFYRYLVSKHSESQIIIVENEHPPEQLVEKMNLTVFTKNPYKGRYGFFPHGD